MVRIYKFDTKCTDCECHICVTSPRGFTRKKRFRNGYAGAKISAKAWIASQIQDIERECKINGWECPDVFVDGVQVVSSDPPTTTELIKALRRIIQQVNERGPESGELFEASCDAEKLIERHERSLRGKYAPKTEN